VACFTATNRWDEAADACADLVRREPSFSAQKANAIYGRSGIPAIAARFNERVRKAARVR
jgi:hypothetical protein